VSGLNGRMKRNKIEVINGRARFLSSSQVEIHLPEGQTRSVRARSTIIATGARPLTPPIAGADSPGVMGTDDLLNLENTPESIAIIGGGVVGLEMATFLSKLGCNVHVLEIMPHCLPGQDAEVVSTLEDVLRKEGIDIQCSVRVEGIEDAEKGKRVRFAGDGGESQIEVAAVAVCAGYQARIDDLGLDECGVLTNDGSIQVNEGMETSVPGVYAAGDVVGGPMLAHVGYAEGKVAAENAMGGQSEMDYQAVPQCIFTTPEVASVGLTEQEATARGHDVHVGRFPFVANGMATILGENQGLVKMVAERTYGQILGVHIVGPRATALIPEAALAIRTEATVQDIQATMHPHPTLSEALWEAALDLTGETLHYSSSGK